MSFKKIFLIALLAIVYALPSDAQTQEEARLILNAAEDAYHIGQVEEAKKMLEGNVQQLASNLKLRGYRLLALCALALEQRDEARMYVEKMLAENPYYTPTVEYSPRFIDMINEIKQGLIPTITTASSQKESLAEVPVPTTLISEDMIHNCGARNLQEVLAAYVPGMNIIDCDDDINVAMRGIYSNSQEKILIMLNGHRMNSYATNVAAPDYSISLEKIKQIEVLRGPASSLYGGVALTAVVNIITKQGADVDGLLAKLGAGNHGQMSGDLVFGKRFFDVDILIWGSLYRNHGEKRGSITIGSTGEKPSYDFGIQLKWNDLKFMYDTHLSQVVAPYTISTLAKPYERDKYLTRNGVGPSFMTSSSHADLSYGKQIGRLDLRGKITFDQSDMLRYQVISDEKVEGLGDAADLNDRLRDIFNHYGGLSRYLSGKEYALTAKMKGDFNYIENGIHDGSVTFGFDYARFKLYDFDYELGYNFTNTTGENSAIQEGSKKHEISNSAYLQLKHKWKWIILNAGLRYDFKKHADDTELQEMSPRVALILLKPKWNLKLSYSKSFVDAPYIYRMANNLNGLITVDQNSLAVLSPERIHSFQLSFAGLEWIKGMTFELNAYHNQSKDLIYTQFTTYSNGGTNKTLGMEVMAIYRHPKFTADFNFTWTHTYDADIINEKTYHDFSSSDLNLFNTKIDANNNTPAIMSNLVLGWQASKRLKLHTHFLFEGKQSSYNIDINQVIDAERLIKEMDQDMITLEEFDQINVIFDKLYNVVSRLDIPAHFICNIGAEYNLGRMTLGLNVRNLFNTHYERSGMNTRLIPQKGCWWMASIAYKF